MPNRYQELEKFIGITFKDKDLLDHAFIHKSFMNEYKGDDKTDNERLEFLGDAVLELTVTEHLFKAYPKNNEGELTNWRSALVKGKHLAEVATDLKLGSYLYLSKGEEKSGGRKKNYILANTVEALIGAMYLDQGYQCTHDFIHKFILVKLEKILEENLHIDAKSHFQELAQDEFDITPEYKLVKEYGPDHSKRFIMAAYFKEKKVAEGDGSSKQKAEESAARQALIDVEWENDPKL
ncbi:ribonuclease III [Patescibacteria group bacterium]